MSLLGLVLFLGVASMESFPISWSVQDEAIYNGQTRHNSNSTGPNYGTQLASGDIIGVALDMVDGTLGYYRNQTYWGVAFKDEELKKG